MTRLSLEEDEDEDEDEEDASCGGSDGTSNIELLELELSAFTSADCIIVGMGCC
jgi:hypothetical protein